MYFLLTLSIYPGKQVVLYTHFPPVFFSFSPLVFFQLKLKGFSHWQQRQHRYTEMIRKQGDLSSYQEMAFLQVQRWKQYFPLLNLSHMRVFRSPKIHHSMSYTASVSLWKQLPFSGWTQPKPCLLLELDSAWIIMASFSYQVPPPRWRSASFLDRVNGNAVSAHTSCSILIKM